jgi:serine/threonine protein kinase
MGVVYRARDLRLNRLVALKMIVAGAHAGSRERARFHTEAETVARLQHPHIVQIYEVGEHDRQLYIAFEYIAGRSLSQELGGAPLPAVPSTHLVETLARAVHYAHQQGIIHRDLKPANVLLQPLSAEGSLESPDARRSSGPGDKLANFLPKVADFGLAKLRDQDSSETRTGDVMGTPSYMSPEQAAGRTQEIGPAADVYALGAILYELLTGRPPFRAASAAETAQQVIHDEPVSPFRLQPRLPRDLGTICLKCLEKQPSRRYPSAQALADDLRRFQDGKPTVARPPSPWERGLKWARRRPAVAALYAVSAMALATLVVTGLIYNRSLQQERNLANEQRDAAEKSRQEAQQHLQLALDAARRFYTNLSGSTLLNVPGQEMLRVELLQQARGFYEKVIEVRGDDPAVLADLANTIWQLGVMKGNVESEAKGIELLQQAASIQDRLAREYPDTPAYQKDLARTYNNMGIFHGALGQTADSRATWERAVALREALVRQHPGETDFRRDLAQSYHNLGNLYRRSGQAEKAAPAYRQAQALQEQLAQSHPDLSRYPDFTRYHRDLALTCFNLGRLNHEVNHQAAPAATAFNQALEIQQKLVSAQPKVQQFQSDVGQTYFYLGSLYIDAGQAGKALEALKKALPIQDRLARDYPKFFQYQSDLAFTYLGLAQVLGDRGDFGQAEDMSRKTIVLQEELIRQRPKTASYLTELATFLNQLGSLLAATGRTADAEAAYQRALSLLKPASKEVGSNSASDLSLTLVGLADLDRDAGRHAAAEKRYLEAIALLEKAIAAKADVDTSIDLAGFRIRLASVFQSTGRRAEAQVACRKALSALQELPSQGMEAAQRRKKRQIAKAHDCLGMLALAAGALPDAESELQSALVIREQLAREDAVAVELPIELAESCQRMGLLEKTKGRFEESFIWYNRAADILESALRKEKRLVKAQQLMQTTSAEWDEVRKRIQQKKAARGLRRRPDQPNSGKSGEPSVAFRRRPSQSSSLGWDAEGLVRSP